MSLFDTITLLNCPLKDIVNIHIPNCLSQPKFTRWVTLNPDILFTAHHHSLLHYFKDAVCVADGIGLIWLYFLRFKRWMIRIPGIDFVEALFNTKRYRVYLLGARAPIVYRAEEQLNQRYPGLVVGFHHGFFSEEAWPSVIEDIKRCRPDIVLVGMGFPRQETLLISLEKALDHGIGIGVGGSIEVWARHQKRAPLFIRKMGFEWLFRIVVSPKRIKRLKFIQLFLIALFSRSTTS